MLDIAIPSPSAHILSHNPISINARQPKTYTLNPRRVRAHSRKRGLLGLNGIHLRRRCALSKLLSNPKVVCAKGCRESVVEVKWRNGVEQRKGLVISHNALNRQVFASLAANLKVPEGRRGPSDFPEKSSIGTSERTGVASGLRR